MSQENQQFVVLGEKFQKRQQKLLDTIRKI